MMYQCCRKYDEDRYNEEEKKCEEEVEKKYFLKVIFFINFLKNMNGSESPLMNNNF